LLRRGFALEIGAVMSFATHLKLVNKLVRKMVHKPAAPGFAAISVETAEAADREAFRLIAEQTPRGVRPDGAGVKPMDAALESILADPEWNLMLLPEREGGASVKRKRGQAASVAVQDASSNESEVKKKPKTAKAKRRTKARQAAALALKEKKQRTTFADGRGGAPPRPALPPPPPAGPPPGGRQASFNARGGRPLMPKVLVGKSHERSSDGERICFGYQLGNCNEIAAGMKCKKGWHACCEPGCEGFHPLSAHPS
jgi:hypothetical protein